MQTFEQKLKFILMSVYREDMTITQGIKDIEDMIKEARNSGIKIPYGQDEYKQRIIKKLKL